VIWVTGASSGIGAAVAKKYYDSGAFVVLSSRSEADLQRVVSTWDAERYLVAPCDVTEVTQCKEVVERIVSRWSRIDIALANAGTYWPTPVARFSSEDHEKIMSVNYGGVVNVVDAVLPQLVAQKDGVLALMSSVIGYRGVPLASAYGASKAAVINFAESIRFELEPQNIYVSVINPGFVKTPLTDQNEFQMPFLIEVDEAAEQILSGLRKRKREIHFPARFSWFLKLMRVVPFSVYHALTSKTVKVPGA